MKTVSPSASLIPLCKVLVSLSCVSSAPCDGLGSRLNVAAAYCQQRVSPPAVRFAKSCTSLHVASQYLGMKRDNVAKRSSLLVCEAPSLLGRAGRRCTHTEYPAGTQVPRNKHSLRRGSQQYLVCGLAGTTPCLHQAGLTVIFGLP